MRVLIVLTAVLLFWGIAVTAGEVADAAAGDPVAGAEKARGCEACHNSPISLKGRGIDVIAEQIRVIQAGDKGHPPGLKELSEQDILDIAAYLDAA